jgi:hypothetical protein
VTPRETVLIVAVRRGRCQYFARQSSLAVELYLRENEDALRRISFARVSSTLSR